MPQPIEVQNVINRYVLQTRRSIIATVAEAINEFANSRTSKHFMAFIEEISQGPGESAAAQVHAELAAEMAEAARRSWGQAKQQLRPYKYDPPRADRFSGGMDRALRDPALVESSAQGIRFGNIAVLDRDAKQWARLDWGAGARGQEQGGSHHRFIFRFSNLPALEFDFNADPRPGYGIPKGLFVPGEAGSAFYLFRQTGGGLGPASSSEALRGSVVGAKLPSGAKLPTKGNKGYFYLEAGITRYFDRAPAKYSELFRTVLPASSRVGRPPKIETEHHTIRAPAR